MPASPGFCDKQGEFKKLWRRRKRPRFCKEKKLRFLMQKRMKKNGLEGRRKQIAAIHARAEQIRLEFGRKMKGGRKWKTAWNLGRNFQFR